MELQQEKGKSKRRVTKILTAANWARVAGRLLIAFARSALHMCV